MLTDRLELRAMTPALCRAEFEGPSALAAALGAGVPPSWPPPVFEPDDLRRISRQLEADPLQCAWTIYYLVQRPTLAASAPVLVGLAGYNGPPTAEGVVEIGYAVASEHQRRGYATEAVAALVAYAFSDPRVARVTATTFAGLLPSIAVLRTTGFTCVDEEPRTGRLRFECRRPPSSAAASRDRR